MSPIDPRGLEIAALSDVGRVRIHNEDCYAEFSHASGARLAVVADGMGGHRGGATASQLAVEAMGDALAAPQDDASTWLDTAFREANTRVHAAALADPALRGMGTTAVALFVAAGGDAWIGHVGDSRAYRLRAGRLERLTADHSVVAEMERRGLITAEEADLHPRRNEILRSVGVEAQVQPELRPLDLEPGDRLLLCTDGLCGVLTDAEIAQVLGREAPRSAVEMLVDAANACGGPDNVTALVAFVPQTTDVASSLDDAEATRPGADASAEGAAPEPGPQAAPQTTSETPGAGDASPPLVTFPLVLLCATVGGLLAFAWVLWH